MHFSQNNLSLVFASLGRNSYRAFNNILSDAPLRKKSKPLSLGLHKTSDFQYLKKLHLQQSISKTNVIPSVNGNIKKYYQYEHKGNGIWDGMLPTNQTKFHLGKKPDTIRSVYFHKSKSMEDILNH